MRGFSQAFEGEMGEERAVRVVQIIGRERDGVRGGEKGVLTLGSGKRRAVDKDC